MFLAPVAGQFTALADVDAVVDAVVVLDDVQAATGSSRKRPTARTVPSCGLLAAEELPPAWITTAAATRRRPSGAPMAFPLLLNPDHPGPPTSRGLPAQFVRFAIALVVVALLSA